MKLARIAILPSPTSCARNCSIVGFSSKTRKKARGGAANERLFMANEKLPKILTTLPGPKAQKIIDGDHRYISPSYTRSYPLVVQSARGAMVEDVDGNRFLDFCAGIAVTSTGHCHPNVVRAIQKQAESLIHMS